jgi:uncharacterized protein (DUF736 family)
MSNYQPKEGTGSLFKNEKKTADNQPDYKGNLMQGGTLYELAGWVKESKTGKKFVSLKIDSRQMHADKKPEASNSPENDGDLPF